MNVNETLRWHPVIEVAKYRPDTVARARKILGFDPTAQSMGMLGIKPDEVEVCEGNALTTAGLGFVADAITGTASQVLDATHTVIGVGNGTTAFSAAHTDLQGASKRFEVVSGAPSATGAVISASAEFGETDGNFAWEEWCIVCTSGAAAAGTTKPAGTMVNRKVQALGTKANGAIWTLSVSITLS